MKKVVILLAVMLSVSSVMMAQKKDRTDAFMYNKNGQLAKAVTAIEKCVNHEQFLGMKANDQCQSWLYRAAIYQNVLQSGDTELLAQYPDAMEKAYESLMKCVENASFTEENKQEIYGRIASVQVHYANEAVAAFNNADYATASNNFYKAYQISKSMNNADVESLKYAAVAAMRNNENETALSYLMELKDSGYDQVDLYKDLAAVYNALGNGEKAFEMINLGLEKDPNDASLIIEKVNVNLKAGKGEEAVNDLIELNRMDPNNVSILFILGTIYGDENNEIFNTDKAIEYYQQALQVNPNYTDAAYNLGALYIGMSNKLKAEANDLPLTEQAKYEELLGQAQDILKVGIPFVKQAYDAQPNDDIKRVLKSMYMDVKMYDEAKALDAE